MIMWKALMMKCLRKSPPYCFEEHSSDFVELGQGNPPLAVWQILMIQLFWNSFLEQGLVNFSVL